VLFLVGGGARGWVERVGNSTRGRGAGEGGVVGGGWGVYLTHVPKM